jgi:predicted signal transduction protein with EAL and GGDEF domain
MKAHLQSIVDAYNLQAEQGQSLTFSLGVIRIDSNSTITMESLLARADEAIYAHKRERKRKL